MSLCQPKSQRRNNAAAPVSSNGSTRSNISPFLFGTCKPPDAGGPLLRPPGFEHEHEAPGEVLGIFSGVAGWSGDSCASSYGSISACFARGLGEEWLDDLLDIGALTLWTLRLLRFVFLNGQYFAKFFVAVTANVFVEGHSGTSG